MRWIGAGLVAVVVLVVAYLLINDGDDDSDRQAGGDGDKELVGADRAQLRELAAGQGSAVYWAGRGDADIYEWTALPNGEVYVRYLTGDAELDDPRPQFLTVGTYPVGDGLEAIETAAEEPGAETFDTEDGGTGLVNENVPTSVYLAYPDSEQQIEVFHPDPDEARDLVESGAIRPIPGS
jgi:hypothetical protein